MIEALVYVTHLVVILILLVAVARLDSGDKKATDLGLFSFRAHAGEGGAKTPGQAATRRPPRA